jgi:hypothetical protein
MPSLRVWNYPNLRFIHRTSSACSTAEWRLVDSLVQNLIFRVFGFKAMHLIHFPKYWSWQKNFSLPDIRVVVIV